jgi:radical SAM superfamily enzyme YgiQ (UPF0313 family)
MRIALVSPPGNVGFLYNLLRIHQYGIDTRALIRYPFNFVLLATMIDYYSKDEHEIKIIDPNIVKSPMKILNSFCPDVVGFTCLSSPSLIWIDNFSRKIKEKFDCKIIFGGTHVTLDPLKTLQTTIADYVMIGEADYTFPALIDFVDGRGKLPKHGIAYKKIKKNIVTKPTLVKDLDKLPLPDYSFLNTKPYSEAQIETSRGCIWNCDFCHLSAFSHSWRGKSANRVLQEIKSLHDNMDMDKKQLFFIDRNPGIDKIRFKKIFKGMIEEKFNCEWFATISIDSLDREILEIMSKTNCHSLFIGVETVSKKRLRYGKLVQSKHNPLKIIRIMKSLGIPPQLSFIIMMPDETKRDLLATMSFCKKVVEIPMKNSISGIDTIFAPMLWQPYPNTSLYNKILKKGFVPPKTFKEWGIFYRDIKYNINRINFTKDILPGDLKLVNKFFNHLNTKYFMIPRLIRICKNYISKDLGQS